MTFNDIFGKGFYLKYIGTDDDIKWELIEPDKNNCNIGVCKGIVTLTIDNKGIGKVSCEYDSKKLFYCLADYLIYNRIVDVVSMQGIGVKQRVMFYPTWLQYRYKHLMLANHHYKEVKKGDIALKLVDELSFEYLRDLWANEEVTKTMDKQFVIDDWANGLIDKFLIDRLDNLVKNPDYYHYCIFYKGKFAGAIWFRGNETKTVGGLLKKDMWGKGIMTKAMKLVLKVIKSDGVTKEVTASHKVNNNRSRGVLKNNGFKLINHQDNLYTYRKVLN